MKYNQRKILKKHRKTVRQMTTGNRVSNESSSLYMHNTLNGCYDIINNTTMSPLISDPDLSLRATYNQNILGKYDRDNNYIIINPCIMNPSFKMSNMLRHVFLHQLMHWTGGTKRIDRKYGFFRDRIGYDDTLYCPSMEYMCEDYLAEYGAKLLTNHIYSGEHFNEMMLIWLEKRMYARHCEANLTVASFYTTIDLLQELAVSTANSLINYIDILHGSGRYTPRVKQSENVEIHYGAIGRELGEVG